MTNSGLYIPQIHYITSPVVIFTIFVKNGQDTMYYVHKDYPGSWLCITNSNGAVVEEHSFDAWGRRRNPNNWTYTGIAGSFKFNRGFTSHEHLDKFGLINMNGRIYDPVLARFLSPDNFVQAPSYTQSFNRYSYCLNNPLKYTDPSGEKWKWWKWVLAFTVLPDPCSASISVAATAGTLYASAFVTAATAQGTAMSLDYTATWFMGFDDPGKAGKRFDQAIKIDAGLFLHIPGWETEQTIIGNGISHFRNLTGHVDNVEIKNWTVLVNDNTNDPTDIGGMTFGPYINSKNFTTNDDIYAHELGHTIQSRILGPLYNMKIAIPSGLSAYYSYYYKNDGGIYHENSWYEVWASKLGGAPNHPKDYRKNNFWYWWWIITLPSFPN